MKTPTLLTDDPAQEDLLQKYNERVERLSQQNRVIKNCIDAGILTTVDVGQFFMTKHTDECSFLSKQRDLEQDNGHSSDLDQRESG